MYRWTVPFTISEKNSELGRTRYFSAAVAALQN